ncbi:MAG: DUF3109 family protein [Bacteroidota bacterium]
MFIIQEKLVSEDLVEEQFLCQLDACKGACCWEGDFGAPLEKEERATLDRIYEDIKPFLREEGIRAIEEQGRYVRFEGESGEYGTPLINDRDCAYLTFEENGIAKCGIEKAYEAGATDFQKPISCHLYPVRVTKKAETGFEALNYDRWDICSAACSAGKKAKLPIYQFVKTAIIRKYGEDFFEELHALAEWRKENG